MSGIQVVICGAGGFGREVAWLIEQCCEAGAPWDLRCFVDDDESAWGSEANGLPVLGLEEATGRFAGAAAVGGVGDPRVRQALMTRAAAAGFSPLTVIHPRVEYSRWCEFGEGALVCAGNLLTTNIVLGRQVQLNLGCTIGHDVLLDDFATLAPGVHVSGNVQIGKRVYIGTGAVILNGTPGQPIVIGDDAVVGGGACVTRSVEAGATVVGVPAKPLQR